MKLKTVIPGIYLVLLFAVSQKLFSQPGKLDPSFGVGGIAHGVFNYETYCFVKSAAIQKDGKIIVAGSSAKNNYLEFAMMRFNPNGSLDDSFGVNGIVSTDIRSSYSEAQSVAIQSDGKIVLGGYTATGTYDYDFALVRYNSDGSPDTSFGNQSIVITSISPGFDMIYSISIQNDGKIVAGGQGQSTINGNNSEYCIARYDSHGDLDSLFGNQGIVLTPVGVSSDVVSSVAIQSDGKIVASGQYTGESKYDIAIIRYDSNGSLDSTFGTDGIARMMLDNSNTSSSVAIQEDGMIVEAGSFYNDSITGIEILRVTSSGSLDTTFGTRGVVLTPVGKNATVASLVIQEDGSILTSGSAWNGFDTDFATERYNKNGSLDNTFGTKGIVITPVGPANDMVSAVLVRNDGKIVACGSSGPIFVRYFTLVQYNPDGSLDTAFARSGIDAVPLALSRNYATAAVLQDDGKIVEAGYTNDPVSAVAKNDFALLRFNTDGKPDNTFGDNGIVVNQVDFSQDFGRAVAVQNDKKIVVAGNSLYFALARYNSNGNPESAFGNNGFVYTDVGHHNDDHVTSVLIQPDGMIVLGGYTFTGNDYDLAIVRYTPDGALDHAFGSNGIAVNPVGSGNDAINSIVLQKNGKIIAAGYSMADTSKKITLARYSSNGTLDETFGDNGIAIIPAGGSGEANSVKIQEDGKIVAGGYIVNDHDTDFVLIRIDTIGRVDNTFGTGGIVITFVSPGHDAVNSVNIQSDGKILAGGVSGRGTVSDFVIARYQDNGTLDNTFGTNGISITRMGYSSSRVNSILLQDDGNIIEAGDIRDADHSAFTLVRYIGGDIATGIQDADHSPNPSSFSIEQNFPNPFDNSTLIKYSIPRTSFVTIKVYDITGQEIATLVNQDQKTGEHEVNFHSAALESGVYFYRMTVGNHFETRRMVIAR